MYRFLKHHGARHLEPQTGMRYRETSQARHVPSGKRKPSARQPGVSPFIQLSTCASGRPSVHEELAAEAGLSDCQRQNLRLLIEFANKVFAAVAICQDVGNEL